MLNINKRNIHWLVATKTEDREELLRISAKKGRAVLFFNHDTASPGSSGHWGNQLIGGTYHIQRLVNVPFWWFVSHHLPIYLLEMISPIVGWCETLGHLPTPDISYKANKGYGSGDIPPKYGQTCGTYFPLTPWRLGFEGQWLRWGFLELGGWQSFD